MPATITADKFNDALDVAYFTSAVGSGLEYDDENKVVRGLRVFRTGRFKDSKGREHSIESSDLDALVENYQSLAANGIFPDVPVRTDHTKSIKDVVGYFKALRRDGDFLVADVGFTEPDAYDKFKRGTYRARSLEVAPLESNAGDIYAPVVQGLAFVDIPAVEGLYRRHEPTSPEGKEHTVADEKVTFQIKGVETTDYEAVRAHLEDLEAQVAKDPEPIKFRVNDEEVTDPEAVQTALDAAAEFVRGVAEAERAAFVKGLGEANVIAAPQIDATIEFAKSLDADQYSKWAKTYEGAVPASLFGQHGNEGPTPPKPPATEHTERDTLEASIAMFRKAGLSDEKIKDTTAAKRLEALDAQSQ